MEQGNKKNSGRRSDKLLLQGSILAAAGIITKLIGFIYRIPMANILGNQGNGIYSVAFGIYNIALTLSSYSLPLAVSKIVSGKLANSRYKNAHRVFFIALMFGIVTGSIACGLLWLGADFLEHLYHRRGLALPLKVLAPTTLVVAVLGVFRGFVQGHGNMVPTAISQVLEQIVNAVISIVAALLLVRAYIDSPLTPAYGAAGGTVGTLCGASSALIFFIILYTKLKPGLTDREQHDIYGREPDSDIMKLLIITILPVILSQTVYQIGYTIDDMMFGNMMAAKHVPDRVVSSLQGVFNTQYNQLVNLPVAVATAMAVSTVPGIVRSKARGNEGELYRRISLVLKFNMAIAFPSAVGLTLLGEPIVAVLFPRLSEYQALSGMLLMTGSAAVVFYALSTITTAILQGCDYMRIPVYHSAISLVLHIALIYVLLKSTSLGIYALIIGNVTFPMLVSILNCLSLKRLLGFNWSTESIIIPQLKCSVIMGAAATASYSLLRLIFSGNLIPLLVSLILSISVYGYALLSSGCFTKSEMPEIPMGTRLMKFVK